MTSMHCDSIFSPVTNVNGRSGDVSARGREGVREREGKVDSNRKLGDAALRAARGDASAMGEVLEVGLYDLDRVVHKTYTRYVVSGAGGDEQFELRTVELFLDTKFPSADNPDMGFLEELGDARNPRGMLWDAGRKFTIDRLRTMGIVREFLTTQRPGDDGEEDDGAGIEAFGDERPLMDDLDRETAEREVKDQVAILRALPLDKRTLLSVVHVEQCMPSDQEIEFLADRRGVKPAKVRAELELRHERTTAARHELDRKREKQESWWFGRIRRREIRLDVVHNVIRELDCGCSLHECALLIGPIPFELLESLRTRRDAIRKVSPAMRARYLSLLAQQLEEDVRRQTEILAEAAPDVAGGYNWEEVAVIVGAVAATAPAKTRKKAANTVTQQYKRVRAKINERMTAKQKSSVARKKASRP